MKRATITLRPREGEPYEVKGWESDIDGVPVVLVRRPGHKYWECCEPRTGLNVSGRSASTRADVLQINREAVERHAADHGKKPSVWFEELIDQFQRREAMPV